MTGPERGRTGPSGPGAHAAAALVILFTTLLLFWDFLSPSTHWVLSKEGEDLTGQFIWWRQFGFEELQRGHLALWDPHLFCGAPFFGGFQSALLYPPNWLFMVLPPPFAVNFTIALHVFLAGCLTYLWVAGRGSHPLSALMAGLLYALGGAYFLHLVPGHLPNLCTMAWIPLAFWALDRYREERKLHWILMGMFALAMEILAGHIQYVYYEGLAAGLYVLGGWRETKNRPGYFSGLALMFAGAALLTAVQLFAGWDAAGESVRAQHLTIDIVDEADITWERLWCLLMPSFFLGWKDYWGGGMYWEGLLYISVTAFVLALYGLKYSSDPQKKTLGWASLFMLFIALGKRSFLFDMFYKYFPLFDHFRGVGKFNILITLFLGALAARGMDEVLEGASSLKNLGIFLIRAGSVFFAAGALFYGAPRFGGAGLFRQYLSHADQMALSLAGCGCMLFLLALLAFAAGKRVWARYGFFVLAFIELFIFAKGNLPSFDYGNLASQAASIQQLYDREPGDYRVLADNTNFTLGTRGMDIWGEDPIIPYRYAVFAVSSQHYDIEKNILQRALFHEWTPSLGLLRLRYVFHRTGNGLTLEKTGLKETPRAYFVDRFQVLKADEILPKTLDPSFDPRREVLLESDPGFTQGKENPKGELKVRDIDSDKLEIEAELSNPALLVIGDNYSKGWKAQPLSAGPQKEYRVMPANGFQRAVPLSAGEHHFYLEYRPASFVVGKWISIVSWICFFVLLGFKKRDL